MRWVVEIPLGKVKTGDNLSHLVRAISGLSERLSALKKNSALCIKLNYCVRDTYIKDTSPR